MILPSYWMHSNGTARNVEEFCAKSEVQRTLTFYSYLPGKCSVISDFAIKIKALFRNICFLTIIFLHETSQN